MYQKRFGLHRKPYQSVQRDGDFFCSASYQEIRSTVVNALRSDLGVAVMTGPAGVGKTVALEAFRDELASDCQTVLVRGGTVRSADDFLYVLHRFLLKSDASGKPSAETVAVRRCDVLERLEKLSEFWGPLTILVDDIHLVHADVFSELRTLLEENAAGQKLSRLMIAGPLSLEETLAQPSMIDFSRRIRTHVFLEPLRSNESVEYLQHHFKNAGGEFADVFAASAVEQMVVAAGGVPRCLNLLADETLVVCEESDLERVTADVVNTALTRLQHLPVVWNSTASSSEDSEDLDAEAAHSSVVEIGGSTQIALGVIEIGGEPSPAQPASSAVAECIETPASEPSGDEPADGDNVSPLEANVDWIEAVEPEEVCCEFVEDEDSLRDSSLIEQINDLAISLNEIEASEPVGTSGASQEAAEQTTGEHIQESFEHHLLLASESRDSGEADLLLEATTAEVDALLNDQAEAANASDSATVEDETDVEALVAEDTISSENEQIFERILQQAAEVQQPEEQILAEFRQWQPAGDWPTEFEVSSAEHTHEVERLEIQQDEDVEIAQSPNEWDDVSEVAATELGRQDSSLYAVQLGNPVPVFDRYTWCEFGRSVSAETPQRRRGYRQTGEIFWPPQLQGVAPNNAIAVEDVHDVFDAMISESMSAFIESDDTVDTSPAADCVDESEYAETSSATGVQESRHQDNSADTGEKSVVVDDHNCEAQEDLTDADSAEESAGALEEKWTDVTRLPVHEPREEVEFSAEQFFNPAESEVVDVEASEAIAAADDAESDVLVPQNVWSTMPLVADVVDEVSQSDQEASDVSAMLDAVELPTPAESSDFSADDEHEPLSDQAEEVSEGNESDELPADEDSVISAESIAEKVSAVLKDGSYQSATDGSVDVAAVIANVVQRYIGEGQEGSSEPLPGVRQHLIAEQAEEEVLREISAAEDEYAPQLLRQAKARILAIHDGSGQLKQAAGAESSVVPQFESQSEKPRLSIAQTDQDEHDGEAAKTASGFGNLFTRLRQMTKGRSA